MGLSSIYRVTV